MSLLDFVTLVLASWSSHRAWFNGVIFAKARARHEALADSSTVSYLLSCRLCFSYHPPFFLVLAFFLPSLFLPPPWPSVVKMPLYALAAAPLVGWLTELDRPNEVAPSRREAWRTTPPGRIDLL